MMSLLPIVVNHFLTSYHGYAETTNLARHFVRDLFLLVLTHFMKRFGCGSRLGRNLLHEQNGWYRSDETQSTSDPACMGVYPPRVRSRDARRRRRVGG